MLPLRAQKSSSTISRLELLSVVQSFSAPDLRVFAPWREISFVRFEPLPRDLVVEHCLACWGHARVFSRQDAKLAKEVLVVWSLEI